MPVANPQNPLVPDFKLMIDSSPLPIEAMAHVISITVDHNTNLPSMFTLELTGSDSQNQDISWIDDQNLFAIGKVVEVKLGYADDLETLIVGEITGLEPEFAFNRLPSLIVRGYDRRHRLQRGRKTQTFVQQKDSDIAAQIANAVGLKPQVEDSQVVHDYILQANQTDIEFLQQRARRIQYEVVVEDKTLFFKPVANTESEILTLRMGEDLLEFYPRLSSMSQVSEVSVRGWNPKQKQEIIGLAKIGDEVSTMGGNNSGAALSEKAFGGAVEIVSHRPQVTQAEADQMAKAYFNNRTLAFITGEGVCWGRTDLRAGKVVKIEGVGRRFSGQYYLTSTTHRYQVQSGYQTHFAVQRNAS
ncbi:MAG: phage late control D family protein [Symploca sp. SIO1C4]|uniref:Phage late control D family protein n=1 Tax=Symploca sp. SIO1C4 TaxID=2607765 RepID=A0A6B3NAQ0_9CYAN|nr:phage late control D family protein [Symploca sp. SIO1C4]